MQAIIDGQQNKNYTDSAGKTITIKKPYVDDWSAEGYIRWAISCGLLEYIKETDKCKITELGKQLADATEERAKNCPLVEIVTCKDCKHNDEDTCYIDGLGVRDDYFCSSGERKE